MKIFLFFLCTTVIATSAQDAFNDFITGNQEGCNCPSDPKYEANEYILSIMKMKFVIGVWTNPNAVFDNEQLAMKDIVLAMINTDVPLWRHAAFVNTVWLASYLQSASYTPSLCAFAQMINATVAWQQSEDEEAISLALDELALTLDSYVMASGDGAIGAAGCFVSKPAQFRNLICHANGLVYNIDDAWSLNGVLMPIEYEKAAKALYNSESYTSRLMGIMATASLTQSLQDFANNIDQELVSQFLNLANTTPVPECCCSALSSKLNKTYTSFGLEASKTTNAIKRKLLSTLNTKVYTNKKYLPPPQY